MPIQWQLACWFVDVANGALSEVPNLSAGTEFQQVNAIVTRIQLKHVWMAPLLWWHSLRTHHSSVDARSLLASTLLLESPRTYFLISLWSDAPGIMESATAAHVKAVAFANRWCRARWSTQWHLTRLSASSRHWPGSKVDWAELARLSGADNRHGAPFVYCKGPIVAKDRPDHPESWRERTDSVST